MSKFKNGKKVRFIVSAMICTSIVFAMFSGFAYENNEEFEYYLNDDGSIGIISPVETLTGVANIPEYIDGHIVKKVGSLSSGAEKEWANVSKIIIPDTVTQIGEIFGETTEEIVIGSGLDSDYSLSLLRCKNLKKIVLNSGCIGFLSYEARNIDLFVGKNVSDLSTDSTGQFQSISISADNPYYFSTGTEIYNKEKTELLFCVNSENLTSLNILPTTERISENAIRGLTKLQDVSIPYGVIEIGRGNFSECSSLLSCTIPDSVQTIGDYCFINNPSLQSVYIGKNVSSFGEHNGYNCFTNDAYGEGWKGAIPSSAAFYIYQGSVAEDYFNIGNQNICITWYENEYGSRPEFNYSYIDVTPNYYTAPILVKYNNEYIGFDQPPIIKNDRTLVPLRKIFEQLGATVEWEESTQTVTSVRDNTSVSLMINSDQLYVNDVAVTLDAPAQLVNDRTMVPARAVAEAFGCTVDWNGSENTVIITEE